MDIETARKKMIFRSWHRGTREMDLILGRFADQFIPTASQAEINDYEQILIESDPDLYNWISGCEQVPEEKKSNPVLMKLIGYQIRYA